MFKSIFPATPIRMERLISAIGIKFCPREKPLDMTLPKTVSWEDSWICSAPTQEWSNRSKLCRDDTTKDSVVETKKLSSHLLTSLPPPETSISPISMRVAIHSPSLTDDSSDSVFAGLESDDSLFSEELDGSFKNNMAMKRWRDLERRRLALKLQLASDNHPLLFKRIEQKLKTTTVPKEAPVMHQFVQQETGKVIVRGEPVVWSGSFDSLLHLPIGFGEMLFRDGQRYTGECQSGLRHGRNGKNVWHNQQTYMGEWYDGKRTGQGIHVWPDGRRVSGSWLKGHLHGLTIHFSWPDGSTYVGGAVNGRKEGKGRQTWSDGRVYEGEYMDGYENGSGILMESDHATVYRGHFQRGTRHGQGVQIWQDKIYAGEWKRNQITGKGELKWKECQDVYKGEFLNGKFHGSGSFRSGKAGYIGEWKNGVKDGVGNQYWANGKAYEGSFVKDKFHGFGCLVQPDGSLYTGTWSHGKRNGQGISLKADGSVGFCGYWKDDLPIANVGSSDNETEFSNPFDEVVSDSRQVLQSKGSLLDGSITTASEEKLMFWD